MKAKTRVLSLLLVMLMVITQLPASAYAASSTKIFKSNAISSDYYYWGGETIKYTFQYADGTSVTTNLGGFAIHYAGENVTSIVGSQVAYCIEPNTGSTSGTTYSGTEAENSSYWQNKLTANQRRAIQLIMLYGAPNGMNSTDANTLFGYEGATQILIWEIVMGLRSPLPPYTLNDSRLKNNFYGNSYFPSTKTAYNGIINKMNAHLNIPSFSSNLLSQAKTWTLNYDAASGLYKGSLTDANGVLSKDYNFSAPGVTFSKSGNTLNISAPPSAFSGTPITASATGNSLSLSSLSQMIWTLSGKQTVTTFQASPDPVPCYFKLNVDGGTANIKKTAASGDVDGYCFKIYRHSSNTEWYGKSDSAGNVFVTNSSYAASGTKVYTFSGLTDGTYTFLEALSKKGKDLVFPDSWTITVKRGGAMVFNKTYTEADLQRDSNGDCRLANVAITGLSGGGVMTMAINNKPETGNLEIVKTSTDGKIKDISFKVEKSQSGNWAQLGIYKTDASGKISITGLAVGTVLRVTEIVPDGYECTSENPQTITLKRGTNRLEFSNKPTTTDCEIIKVSDDGKVKDITFTVKDSSGTVIFSGKTDKNGKINVPGLTIGETYTFIETVPEDYVAEKREQTVKMKSTGNTVTFTNHPVSRLELIKQSDDNNVSGLSFKLEQFEPEGGIGWWTVGTYQTDQNGMITEDILYGYKYRITETVPDDYVCENRVQEFIAATGTNTVHFVNHPTSRLELIKTSDDGNVRGISFTLEQYEPEDGIGWWTVGTYQTDQNGKITEDLLYGYKYRVTETVPEDYVCDNRVQEFTAQTGTNTVTFVNHPIVKLELIKSADNGHVADIGFKFEKYDTGSSKWVLMDTYQTDADGKIHLEDLSVGLRLRITELVPAGYQTETVTKEITLVRGTNTVSFENYRIYGDLELIKVDESYPDTTLSGAEFTVTITYPGREPVEVPMPEVLDDQGNGTGVYRLEHIEYGSVCVVRETKAPEGFELSDKSFTVTIEEAKTYSIGDPGFDCVTNREKSGKIQIKKVDTQGRAMPGVSFLLEFSLDGTNWAPVTFRETDSAVTAGGCTNQNLDHGILVTDRNGLAVYPGLALSLGDRVLYYRLTEVSTQNGMQLLSEPAFEGTLPYNGAEEIAVTAVNTEGFTIPETGGPGFVGTTIGVSLAGAAALALLLLLRKKKGAAA